ncbi:MAG TPA: hypothetical protein ENN99_08810 [Chloroflexi bacterium]|nr:hypothetical protein [Chloroflexota bacterium]
MSNSIRPRGASTKIRSILDQAYKTGQPAPDRVPDRTLAVRVPSDIVEWLRCQANTKDCAMAEIVRAYIASQIVSDLTALYQKNTHSAAEFSAAVWSALGYEPDSLPGEETCNET